MSRVSSRSPILVWLRPGAYLKRWLLLAALALVMLSLGVGITLADFYRHEPFPEFVYYLTLQFVPRLVRGVLLATLGLALGVVATVGFSRSLLGAILPGPQGPVIRAAIERRHLQAGPRIVAIGGGTGLSTLLKGLKEVTANLTAIVTVADDGGSSGRLRRDYGILPPGDFRQCLVALADAEPQMSQLLEHRFGGRSDLAGHSFGNLFLAALAESTGSFERALEECSRVLAVRGRVLPATLTPVTLGAELADGRTVSGESAIGHAGSPISRVFLEPSSPVASPEALAAIGDADAIIVGPGSLYTSILPNLLVPEIARAVRESAARKIYVCNVATEPGETVGYAVGDFVRILESYLGVGVVDRVLANDRLLVREGDDNAPAPEPVRLDFRMASPPVVGADLLNESNPARHDSRKLAAALVEVALR